MFRSIRWRLAASYAALILLSVSLMGALALSFLQRYVDRQERGFLKANAETVSMQAERFMTPQVRKVALGQLAFTSAFLGNARVRILDESRQVLADSGDPEQPDEFLWLVPSGFAETDTEKKGAAPFIITMPPPPKPGMRRPPRELIPFLRDLPLGTSRLYARRFSTPWGRRFSFETDEQAASRARAEQPARPFLTVTLPVGAPGNPLGFVELSSPRTFQNEAIVTMRTSLIVSGLGALAIAVAFGFLVGKTMADPLTALSGAARRMAGGDLAARAPAGRTDEIGALALQFNAMATNLEGSFRALRSERDTLRRFVADASHELRTPITALATFTELLQGSASDDPQARAEFLQESSRQLQRLEWITRNLLDLSRLDAGIAALEFGGHGAGEILELAAGPLRAMATEKRIDLAVETPPDTLHAQCDRQRIVLAISNLVANAVKFSPPGGHVSLSADEQAGSTRFLVRDDGPGISAEDLPHIFERFFRGSNRATEGAGLGLAIVKSVADAHGGSIRAEGAPGGGSLFILEIPRDRGSASA